MRCLAPHFFFGFITVPEISVSAGRELRGGNSRESRGGFCDGSLATKKVEEYDDKA